MFNSTLKSLAIALGLLAVAPTAHAATEIIGGTTHIKLDADFTPVLLELNGGLPGLVGADQDPPLSTFDGETGTLGFAISGGHVGDDTIIEHAGVGLTLNNGSTDVSVTDFSVRVIGGDLGSSDSGVFGKVNGEGDFAKFFTYGDVGEMGIELVISDILSDTLVGFFGLDPHTDLSHTTFGYATPKPSVVPLPAAGWLMLAALGGLGLARRRSA